MAVIKTPTGMILSFTVARKKMSPPFFVFVFVFVFEAADRTDRKETLLTLSSWNEAGPPLGYRSEPHTPNPR